VWFVLRELRLLLCRVLKIDVLNVGMQCGYQLLHVIALLSLRGHCRTLYVRFACPDELQA